MNFGIENPSEGPHVPGSTCPACATGYPKSCIPPPAADRVLVGKVAHQDLRRVVAATCPGYVHGELVEGRKEQRCDTCGVPSERGESQILTAADVAVVKAEDILPR